MVNISLLIFIGEDKEHENLYRLPARVLMETEPRFFVVCPLFWFQQPCLYAAYTISHGYKA